MINLTQAERQKLVNFFNACDEMIEGRFILSDLKISKILKSIADSKVIYDLITSSLVNFNFEKALRDSKTTNRVNGGYFKMPQDENKIIALVFCLLVEVNANRMNLQTFVTDNFYNSQGYNVSYSNFAHVVLIPFKNSVQNLLGVNEQGLPLNLHSTQIEENQITMDEFFEDEMEVESDEMLDSDQKIMFANLSVALTELVGAIKISTKLKVQQKEELLIVANAMADSIKNQNLKMISALVIAFEYALNKNKFVKPYYDRFVDTLVELL